MNKQKYNIGDIVYIAFQDNILECKIKEIHITSYIYYIVEESKNSIHLYNKREEEIFKTYNEVKKFIEKRNLIDKVDNKEEDVAKYKSWINELDFAIQHYERCETKIVIHLQSNQTNKGDEILFAVENRNSKTLLENIRKYFKEEYDKRELELQKLKKEFENEQDNVK